MINLQTCCLFIEKYGLFLALLVCFQLLPPDLRPKASLMERDLEAFNDNIGGSDIFKQIFWMSAFLVFSFCLFKNGIRYVGRESHTLLISWAVLLLTCATSILWSSYPSYTVKRVILQILVVSSLTTAVFFSITHATFDKNIRNLLYVSLAIGAISFGIQGGMPASGFAGWAKTKNSFGGVILALMLMLYLKSYFEGQVGRVARTENLFFAIGLAGLLVLSLSKTSIALGGLLLLLVFLGRAWNKSLFLLVFCTAIFFKILLPGLALWYGTEWNVAMYLDDEDLTGRGYIWRLLYDDLYNFERLPLGYGFGAYFGVGETPLYLDDPYSYVRFLNSAHSSYVELLLQLGVACSLIVLLTLSRMVLILNCVCCFVCATIIGLHGLSESSIFKDVHVMWVMLIVSLAFGSYAHSKTFTPPTLGNNAAL